MTQDQFDAEQAYNARQEAYREEVLDFVDEFYAEEIEDAMKTGATIFCTIGPAGEPSMILATTILPSLINIIEAAMRAKGDHFYVIHSEHTKGYYVL